MSDGPELDILDILKSTDSGYDGEYEYGALGQFWSVIHPLIHPPKASGLKTPGR
ncbi:hypothetical protein POX_f08149 [Penicillium oxalicum]|uniref:Uncharacterized protein n=1 Tax=Penicillium oxalicum (strain 114-2 / CGMCC 5302) TaxID=933388 RepID=S7ZEK1_PENO1|nr:hypothetical protein POX_f08149 [Penicillium oxalicum]EPS29095.1 hypothetical protein PDE_04044 [Penicillium oxalicum 114-2]KAI2787772.1 hypothetical protein POX_f08149 [Penicillium oxalicum]